MCSFATMKFIRKNFKPFSSLFIPFIISNSYTLLISSSLISFSYSQDIYIDQAWKDNQRRLTQQLEEELSCSHICRSHSVTRLVLSHGIVISRPMMIITPRSRQFYLHNVRVVHGLRNSILCIPPKIQIIELNMIVDHSSLSDNR